MTDQLDRIECATHGQAYATYVCEHLVRASGAEWYSAEPIDEDPWPGAQKPRQLAFAAELGCSADFPID
jgi:hypothetical protein